ncbi:MAG: cation diffusion facilitator family transporter [Ruminococcus flavefaciens]|nr:cation diffusion facilitator family transporter [Ruminococcus flavefaciens]
MENNEKQAVKVSAVSISGNFILSIFKLFAGITAHSGAMVSDAVHSASDVFSSIIVIIGVKLSSKASDREHPYGHERFECVSAIVLAVVLLVTGLFIGAGAIRSISSGDFSQLAVPELLALVSAGISIAVKEGMFWYTRHYAKLLKSDALMADAWHHRSDALSSVGALIGIAGARMGFPVLDPVASLVICVFIIKASVDIFRESVGKMTDRSCDDQTESLIRECVMKQDGVQDIDMLRTRQFGSRIYADIEIAVQSDMSLTNAHAIAERVHSAVEKEFPDIKHIMVHVNPAE